MIVNIRGTSGSGKTTLVRELMAKAESITPWEPDGVNYPVRVSEKTGKVGQRRTPWGYLLQLPGGRRVALIGSYEATCGGCDTMPNLEVTFEMIRRGHELGYDVVFEGLLYSAEFNRTAALHTDGLPLLVIGLDTPLQVCLDSVNERRKNSKKAARMAARGEELGGVNPKNTESKYKGTQQTMKKFQAHGVDARWCTRDEAAALLSYTLGL